jgi:hypothetical protein
VSADPSSLAEPLRSATVALLKEANKNGPRVVVASARRSRSEQIELRRAHCGERDYDVFQKPSMECTPPTARPGESQHELGRAVDFGGDLALVAELAPKHGLVATVAGEPWHYEHSTVARGAGAGEGTAVLGTTEESGGGSLVGSALGNVPLVGGALSAAWGWKDALANLAKAITDRKFWLRLVAAWVGFWLVAIGMGIIAFDATRIDASGAADIDVAPVVV